MSPSNSALRQFVRVGSAAAVLALAGAALPAQTTATASFRGGPSHTGVYEGGGSTIAGIQWRFPTNGDITSSAAIVGNMVYVGSGDGFLYALDLNTGAPVWSFDAKSAVSSSPAVSRGTVFYGTYDGHFGAVDAKSGVSKWRISTGALVPFPWGHESGDRYTSSPNVVNGVVVFGAGDGRVYAADAATGKIRWHAATGGRVRGSPAIADNTVFVGSFDGRVYAFDLSTGVQRWQYDTEGASLASGSFGYDRRSIQSSPAVANGVVFVGARDGFVYAIGAADGKLRWRHDHRISWINSSPAVADGMVYDGTSDGLFVQAVDETTGKEVWRTPTTAPVWSSPAVAGNQLLVGDGDGKVHVYDRRTGKEISVFTAGNGVFASPVVAGDLAVVGSMDGSVYALRLANGAAVQRAVYMDSAYVRADAAGRSVAITTYLSRRGYTVLDPGTIGEFLRVHTADHAPSVVVFAADHVPPSIATGAPRNSPLRKYLEAGGKVVWTGTPPMLWSIDSAGKIPGLLAYTWDAPSDLLGVPHAATMFDPRSVRATADGLRWGQPRTWRSAWGVEPAGVTRVLGVDDWGLAAAWVRSYGGPEGTGLFPPRPMTSSRYISRPSFGHADQESYLLYSAYQASRVPYGSVIVVLSLWRKS